MNGRMVEFGCFSDRETAQGKNEPKRQPSTSKHVYALSENVYTAHIQHTAQTHNDGPSD